MRLAPLLTLSILALALAACGPSGDDDHTGDDDTAGAPDANSNNPAPDANTTTENTSTELGHTCTGAAGECPTDTPDCITLDNTNGFCSNVCGTSADNQTPPTGGDAMCVAQYDGNSGTPTCAAVDTCPGGTCTWHCLILCGTSGTTDLGTCPNGLVCGSNNACGGTP
jgi:hypothetical protein